MPGTVNQRASPRYLPKTNVGFVREKSLLFLILPLDKSHFITEVYFMARKKDSSQKAALREMMSAYLK